MLSDAELITQWEHHKSVSDGGLSCQYLNTRRCQAFYSGNEMQYQDFIADKDAGRKLVIFNKVKPYINAVSGFLSQTSPIATYFARIDNYEVMEDYNRYMNALSEYARFNTYAESHENHQNKDMLTCGYGATDTNMTYGEGFPTSDPNGQIGIERVHPLDVGWDPNARHANLLDARWVYRVKQYETKEALEIFDAQTQDFEHAQPEFTQPTYFRGGGQYDKVSVSMDTGETPDLVNVYYYQYYTTEVFYRAKNPLFDIDPMLAEQIFVVLEEIRQEMLQDADKRVVDDLFTFNPRAPIMIMAGSVRSRVKEIFDRLQIPFNAVRQKRKVFYTAIISGQTVFDHFKSPDQQGYTLKFKTADYDDDRNMWVGMVNSLMQPSMYYNKSLTELMYIIAANSKGGLMYEEGATDDEAELEEKWTKTNAAIKLLPGGIAKIKQKDTPQLNTGYEIINQVADTAISEVVGLDRSFFGATQSGMESGALFAQRIAQAYTVLQTYVDAVKVYTMEHGRLMVTFLKIFAENSPGRLIRILSQKGAEQFLKLSSDNFVDEYDVAIQDGPKSAIERESVKQRKIMLADKLLTVGINIFPAIIKDMDFDPETEQQIQEMLTPKPPSPEEVQMQQVQAQMAMADKQADISRTQADARYKDAQTQRSLADVQKLSVETQKDAADAYKTQQEGLQTELETLLMRSSPLGQFNFSI